MGKEARIKALWPLRRKTHSPKLLLFVLTKIKGLVEGAKLSLGELRRILPSVPPVVGTVDPEIVDCNPELAFPELPFSPAIR